MHILLVNTNPVVSRLISLNTRDNLTIQVDEIGKNDQIPSVWYDVVFIDEKCCDTDVMRMHLQKVGAGKKVLFSSKEENAVEWVDTVIKKPFLPSEITAVLQPLLLVLDKEIDEEETDEIEAFDENDEAYAYDTDAMSTILNGNEIEKIKRLLLDEELEVLSQEEYDMEKSESVIIKEEEKPQKQITLEETLLGALIDMKSKKIRKLLKGAEVSITIRFPGGE